MYLSPVASRNVLTCRQAAGMVEHSMTLFGEEVVPLVRHLLDGAAADLCIHPAETALSARSGF